jgi:hypothetical protein
MSRRLLPQAATAGGLSKTPPRGSQPVVVGRQALPSQALWYIWLSVPSPKMSRRLLPQEVTAIAFLIIVAASRDRDPLSLTAETLLLPIRRVRLRVPSTIRFDGPISLGGIERRT